MDPPTGKSNGGITEQAAPERLGKYPLLSVIGKGSMGIIYRSVDPHIKRPVALKTYSAPRLTPLGGIDSLVRANPGSGTDALGTGNSDTRPS